MSIEESAERIATILSEAMNLSAVVNNEPALLASNYVELRAKLLWFVDEMSWLASDLAREAASTLSWPPDAQPRIDHLRAVATAWEPANLPPSKVVQSARDCLRMLMPSA